MPEAGDSSLIEILLEARGSLVAVLAEANEQAKGLRGGLGGVKEILDQASTSFAGGTRQAGELRGSLNEATEVVNRFSEALAQGQQILPGFTSHLLQMGAALKTVRTDLAQMALPMPTGVIHTTQALNEFVETSIRGQMVLPGFASHVTRLGDSFQAVNATLVQGVLPGFEQFTRAAEEADDTIEELTAQTVLLNAALVLAGKYALDAAIDMALLSGRSDELQVIVEQLGRVHGVSTGELAAYREEIEAVGIAQIDTLQVMARFLGMQLDLTGAANLARVSQDLATIGAQDTSEAYANITHAIGSLHPRILRQYGIYIDLNNVWKDTSIALGKQVDELTDVERRQGMLNAVLEAGKPFVGAYEEAMRTAGKQARTLAGRDLKNLRDELGDGLQPAFLGIVTILRDFVGLLQDLPGPAQTVIGNFIAWAGATTVLWKGLGLLSVTVAGPLVGAIVLLTGAVISLVGAFKQVQGEAAEFRKGAIEAAREAGLSWEELRAIMENYYESLSVREKIAWQMQGGLRHQLELMKLEWQGVQGAAAEAADDIEEALSRVEDMAGIVAEALKQAMAELETIPDRAEAIEDMKKALIDLMPTARLFSLDMEDMADATGLLAENMIMGTEAARNLEDIITRLALPVGDAVEVMRQLDLSAWDAQGNMKDLDQIMAEFIEKTADLARPEQLAMLQALVGPQALPAAAAMAGLGGFGGAAGAGVSPRLWGEEATALGETTVKLRDFGGALDVAGQSMQNWPAIQTMIFGQMISDMEGTSTALAEAKDGVVEGVDAAAAGMMAFGAGAQAYAKLLEEQAERARVAYENYLPMIMKSADGDGEVAGVAEAQPTVFLPLPDLKGWADGLDIGEVALPKLGEFGEVALPKLGEFGEGAEQLMPIAPEDRLERTLFGVGSGGEGGKLTIEVPIYLDGAEITRVISKRQGRDMVRRGAWAR